MVGTTVARMWRSGCTSRAVSACQGAGALRGSALARHQPPPTAHFSCPQVPSGTPQLQRQGDRGRRSGRFCGGRPRCCTRERHTAPSAPQSVPRGLGRPAGVGRLLRGLRPRQTSTLPLALRVPPQSTPTATRAAATSLPAKALLPRRRPVRTRTPAADMAADVSADVAAVAAEAAVDVGAGRPQLLGEKGCSPTQAGRRRSGPSVQHPPACNFSSRQRRAVRPRRVTRRGVGWPRRGRRRASTVSWCVCGGGGLLDLDLKRVPWPGGWACGALLWRHDRKRRSRGGDRGRVSALDLYLKSNRRQVRLGPSLWMRVSCRREPAVCLDAVLTMQQIE